MFAEKSFYETRGKELSVKISKLKAIQIKKKKQKKTTGKTTRAFKSYGTP